MKKFWSRSGAPATREALATLKNFIPLEIISRRSAMWVTALGNFFKDTNILRKFLTGFIIPTIVITVLYVITTIYLMNFSLVKDTLFDAHPLAYKWNLMVALLAGMWTVMSKLGLVLLVIIAFLTGANLTLLARRLLTLRSSGKLCVVVGGSSLLGIVGSGCVSCGLPILAFLGLGGAVAYLPFRGFEVSFLAIVLLIVSLYFLLKNQPKEKVCII